MSALMQEIYIQRQYLISQTCL